MKQGVQACRPFQFPMHAARLSSVTHNCFICVLLKMLKEQTLIQMSLCHLAGGAPVACNRVSCCSASVLCYPATVITQWGCATCMVWQGAWRPAGQTDKNTNILSSGVWGWVTRQYHFLTPDSPGLRRCWTRGKDHFRRGFQLDLRSLGLRNVSLLEKMSKGFAPFMKGQVWMLTSSTEWECLSAQLMIEGECFLKL